MGALLAAAIAACSEPDRRVTPPIGVDDPDAGDLLDAGQSGPPAADAGGLCGNEIHHIVVDPPNLYFVFDVSGSMASIVPGTGSTRYQLVRKSATDLIHKLGSLVNVGAAAFPLGASANDSCHVGSQIMKMSPGDPAGTQLGPTGFAFAKATSISPIGGTPTAATLNALRPTITAIGGHTVVILATDGGPNCNAQAMCGVDECMPNIEGQCDPSTNCCAPNIIGGPENCLDRAPSVDAVTQIQKAGVPVYIVGIPGSELYGNVLDQMALAGGAPQISPPYYYKVTDFNDLGAVLGSIAAAQVSCVFELDQPPKDPDLTNVYFDQTVVPYDDVDGWVWKPSPSVIELYGKACQELKAGQVARVQITTGCPTEAPK